MKKRRYLLATSLLLLLLSAGYGLTSLPEQEKLATPSTAVRQTPKHKDRKTTTPQLPSLNLSLLQVDKAAYRGSTANLFRSLHKPLPTRQVSSVPLRKPKPPVVAEIVAEPPPPQPPSLVYLGQLRHDDRQTVFLRQNEEVFLVHEGELFGKRQEFRVAAIRPEGLQLAWEGSDTPVFIPLASHSEGHAHLW